MTGAADKVFDVFVVIGAVRAGVRGDAGRLPAGRTCWAGPRAGFNPAGWISWLLGFAVGAFNLVVSHIAGLEHLKDLVPVPPLAAFAVGFVLYLVLAKIGLQSKTLEMPTTEK